MFKDCSISKVLTNVTPKCAKEPVWLADSNELLFVDPFDAILVRYHPGSGQVNQIQLDGREFATCAVPAARTDSSYLVPCVRDLVLVDWPHGSNSFTQTVVGSVETDVSDIRTRMNDGKTDRRGRFWFGSMGLDWDDPALNVVHRARGYLYSFDNGVIKRHNTKILQDLSNGIGWLPDDSRMFFADTGRRVITCFDYDVAAGEISNERILVDFHFIKEKSGGSIDLGLPDSLIVDGLGRIWTGCYSAGCVACFDPETGALLGQIKFPASRGTNSITFSEPGTAYVTCHGTPQWGGDSGGSVYRVDGLQGVHGQDVVKVRL